MLRAGSSSKFMVVMAGLRGRSVVRALRTPSVLANGACRDSDAAAAPVIGCPEKLICAACSDGGNSDCAYGVLAGRETESARC